jgi:hypothetical protein
MIMSRAYWISPQGEALSVAQSHIRLILDNPARFNLKKERILQVYKKYHEKIGIEGKARAEIMMDLIKKGWIRVRYVPRSDSWTIQLYYWSETEKKQVKDWLETLFKADKINRYSALRILILNSRSETIMEIDDIIGIKK